LLNSADWIIDLWSY